MRACLEKVTLYVIVEISIKSKQKEKAKQNALKSGRALFILLVGPVELLLQNNGESSVL